MIDGQCAECYHIGEFPVVADNGWEVEVACTECGASTYIRIGD